jgi:hypothetical protein
VKVEQPKTLVMIESIVDESNGFAIKELSVKNPAFFSAEKLS